MRSVRTVGFEAIAGIIFLKTLLLLKNQINDVGLSNTLQLGIISTFF